MPDIRVQDEQGNIHIFPDGSTPEMIAKAMNVKPPSEAPPDALAQSHAQTQSVVRDVSGNMQPSFWGGAHPTPLQENTINALLPRVPGRVSDIRKQAFAAGGAAFGGELAAGAARGLPWLIRTMAGASGAGAGAGVGNLAGGGSPSEALETAAGTTATAAPLTGLAEGAPALRTALGRVVRDPVTGKIRSPWELAWDKVAPDPYAPQAIPAKPIPKGTNYGQYLANQKGRVPEWQSPAHEEFQLGSPEYPGPFSPISNKLPASLRGDPFSPKLPPPRLSPFAPNATPTSTPVGSAQLPPAGSYELPMMVAPEQSPYAAPIEAPSAEGVPGSVPKPSGRLVVLPEEARALDQMQQIATKRASEHGMQYAAGMRPAGGGRVPMTPTSTRTVEFSGTREAIPQGSPTPFSAPLKMETDSLGIRWAVSPDGYRISIPRSVPDAAVETYARSKLAEQAQVYSASPWMKSQR